MKLYLLSSEKLEHCHELWVSPNSVSISCWTPLNSLSCFPAWACRTRARHSVCTGDLTHRKWKLWMCMCCLAYVCALFVRVCERALEYKGWGVGGLKQDMLGITQSTKSVTWSETQCWFIWLQKESVACGLEERMFSFFALSVLRHNTWKHFLRGHGSVKKKKNSRHFISSPSFHSFLDFFFPLCNWLNYIHLLAICRNSSVMNICDALMVVRNN